VDDLRRRMMDLLRADQDPRALGNGAVFDTYQYVGGRGKGYDTWLKTHESKAGEELRPPAREAKKKKRQGQP
jgi:hypothetical protein